METGGPAFSLHSHGSVLKVTRLIGWQYWVGMTGSVGYRVGVVVVV